MAYCRWSSDDFTCDLYCYEDVRGGYTTHIAGARYAGPVPSVTWGTDPKAMADQMSAQMAYLENARLVSIDLPHAGETFNDPTLQAFKDRLLHLRGLGYRFPDYVLTEIDEEMAEEKRA